MRRADKLSQGCEPLRAALARHEQGANLSVPPGGLPCIVKTTLDAWVLPSLDLGKTALGLGGALAGPTTAYQPIGQQLWLNELESYNTFPPLQAPETYNLSGILAEVKKANESHPGD